MEDYENEKECRVRIGSRTNRILSEERNRVSGIGNALVNYVLTSDTRE